MEDQTIVGASGEREIEPASYVCKQGEPIRAVKWTGDNLEQVREVYPGIGEEYMRDKGAYPGCYVISPRKGRVYFMGPDAFEQGYERVPAQLARVTEFPARPTRYELEVFSLRPRSDGSGANGFEFTEKDDGDYLMADEANAKFDAFESLLREKDATIELHQVVRERLTDARVEAEATLASERAAWTAATEATNAALADTSKRNLELQKERDGAREKALREAHDAYDAHYHVSLYQDEKLTRECADCGKDLVDSVHLRSGETRNSRIKAILSLIPGKPEGGL